MVRLSQKHMGHGTMFQHPALPVKGPLARTVAPCFCVLLMTAGLASLQMHRAQAQEAPRASSEIVTPVEIAISTVNDAVVCAPPRARLPARNIVELRVLNQAREPIMFVAPKFFEASQIQESGGFTLDLVEGGFLVAPQSTIWVRLRTPPAGEYYYSCYAPGRVPTPQSSGFLIVVTEAQSLP